MTTPAPDERPVPSQSRQVAAARQPTLLTFPRPTLGTLVEHFWVHVVASLGAGVLGYLAAGRLALSGAALAGLSAVAAALIIEWREARSATRTTLWERDAARRARFAARDEDIPVHRQRPLHPDPKPVPMERSVDEMRVRPPQ